MHLHGTARRGPWARLLALTAVTAAAGAVATSTAHAAAGLPQDSASCALTPGLASAYAALGAGEGTSARARSREPSAWKNAPIEEAPATRRRFRASIPVYIHVFTDGTSGALTRTQISQQIEILNRGFRGGEGGADTGFSFTLAGVDTTDNAAWFSSLDPGTTVERDAKAATHTGDARTLNVWTTAGPSYLGFATFPSGYKTSSVLDGVVLDYQSFPGGAYGSAYSLGETATHEVGHWLGLLHTFQGGCTAKGDYVDDTPAEATPTSGCAAGKDTCPAPGTDPVRNYMDYSYDSCYEQFTEGQAQRMRDQYAAFRADGGAVVGNS